VICGGVSFWGRVYSSADPEEYYAPLLLTYIAASSRKAALTVRSLLRSSREKIIPLTVVWLKFDVKVLPSGRYSYTTLV
jgi:hypothetical protein